MNSERADHLGFVAKECARCGMRFAVRQRAHLLCDSCALEDEAASMEALLIECE